MFFFSHHKIKGQGDVQIRKGRKNQEEKPPWHSASERTTFPTLISTSNKKQTRVGRLSRHLYTIELTSSGQPVLYIFLFFSLSGVPANAILEMFGKMFFKFCQESGYDTILQVLGATVSDFLQVSERYVGWVRIGSG